MLSFVKNLRQKLSKTKSGFIDKIDETVKSRGVIDDEITSVIKEVVADLSAKYKDE